MRMNRIARASIAGLLLFSLYVAITGAFYEMIGRLHDAQHFPSVATSSRLGSIH